MRGPKARALPRAACEEVAAQSRLSPETGDAAPGREGEGGGQGRRFGSRARLERVEGSGFFFVARDWRLKLHLQLRWGVREGRP